MPFRQGFVSFGLSFSLLVAKLNLKRSFEKLQIRDVKLF